MKRNVAKARGFVHLVGVGPGEEAMLTLGAVNAIESADEVWMQSLGPLHCESRFLRKYLIGKRVVNLNDYYDVPNLARADFYRLIEQRMLHLASNGRQITFLLPGNPFIWVYMTRRLKEHAAAGRLDLRITPGISFLDVVWQEVPLDVLEFQLRIGGISAPDVSTAMDCVVGQVGDASTTGSGIGSVGIFTSGLQGFCADVARLYPPSHAVFLSGHYQVHGHGQALYRKTTVAELPDVLPLFESTQYCVILPAVRAS